MTFTFTIDCMPGYTKFNKVNKVLACTQFIEAAGMAHDYSNKTITGHVGREHDEDVDAYYSKSIFEDAAADGGAGSDPSPALL